MFEFGPSMTFFTNTEYQDNGEPKNTLDVNDLYKSSDLGLNVGLTLSPAERIDLGLRYYLGLTNLSTLDPDVSGVNIKSTAIQLALTCSF